MKNAVGREIPEEILKATGKEVFHGVHYYDGYEYQKDGPKTRCVEQDSSLSLLRGQQVCNVLIPFIQIWRTKMVFEKMSIRFT